MDLRQYAAAQTGIETPPPAPLPVLAREQAQEAQEELTRAEVYKRYQEATKASEQARTAITKGLQAGSNPYRLLIIAADCIGRLTGDESYGERTKGDILRIQGAALGEPEALEIELEEVETRLERLRHYQGPDAYRVQAAIREHERRAADIRAKM